MSCSESKKEMWLIAKHKNKTIREYSRSGGVFTELANFILSNGGTVYGCELNENFDAIHKKAITAQEIKKFSGSKYLQSNILNVFDEIVEDLLLDKYVLFSGTPCQISAVKKYVQIKIPKKEKNLILVDIVCHGVPSSKVWHDYLKYIKKKRKRDIKSVDFRNKKIFGWADHVESFYFFDGTVYHSTYFRYLFFRHFILRPSCFSCKYKGYYESDITLGDAWGLNNDIQKFDDNLGISLVISRTEMGKKIINQVIDKYDTIEVPKNYYMQEPLYKSCDMPTNRDQFWRDYHKKSFEYVIKRYASDSFSVTLKRAIKVMLKKGGIYERNKVNKL